MSDSEIKVYVGKAQTNPSTLRMDGTSPVVVHVQATGDELRDMHNQQVAITFVPAGLMPRMCPDCRSGSHANCNGSCTCFAADPAEH